MRATGRELESAAAVLDHGDPSAACCYLGYVGFAGVSRFAFAMGIADFSQAAWAMAGSTPRALLDAGHLDVSDYRGSRSARAGLTRC